MKHLRTKSLLYPLIILMIVLYSTGCGPSRQEMVSQRITRVLEIHDSTAAFETIFLTSLNRLNAERNDSAYSDNDLQEAASRLNDGYEDYLRNLDGMLVMATMLDERTTCPSVDALSVFIEGMAELATVRYSEMVRLSSLPYESYTEAERETYIGLVSASEQQRNILDQLFREAMQKFAEGNGVELTGI